MGKKLDDRYHRLSDSKLGNVSAGVLIEAAILIHKYGLRSIGSGAKKAYKCAKRGLRHAGHGVANFTHAATDFILGKDD